MNFKSKLRKTELEEITNRILIERVNVNFVIYDKLNNRI